MYTRDVNNSLLQNNFRFYNEPDIVPKVQITTGIELNSLNFANLPHSIGGYHSLDTYLYMLQQQVQK